jgi:hypothetical protein
MRAFVVGYRWAVVLAGVAALAAPVTAEKIHAHAPLTTVRFPSVGFDPTSQAVRVSVVNPSANASWAVAVFYTAAGCPLKRATLELGPHRTGLLDLTPDDLCGVTGRTAIPVTSAGAMNG